MGVYKHGKSWWIDYYHAGSRVRERVGPVKDEARIVLSERLEDIRQGRNPRLRQIKPKPFAEMVTEFLEKHASKRRSHRTFKVRKDRLVEHFKGNLQDIGPKQIQEYISVRMAEGASRSTCNRDRGVLSCIFARAAEWQYFGGENPCRRVKKFEEPPGRDRHLTGAEAKALLGACADHLEPIVVTALHSGGRLSEVLALKWEGVNLEAGLLRFDGATTKSGKSRTVPITPELAAILRQWRKVRRTISGDGRDFVFTWRGNRMKGVRTAFNKARTDAKLGPQVGFHTLRHTFASWFVLNGGDLYRLQKYLGHSTIALTQRYAHLSPDFHKAGVQFIGAPPERDGHILVTNGRGGVDAGSTSA